MTTLNEQPGGDDARTLGDRAAKLSRDLESFIEHLCRETIVARQEDRGPLTRMSDVAWRFDGDLRHFTRELKDKSDPRPPADYADAPCPPRND